MKNIYLAIFILAFSFVIQAQETSTFIDPRDGKTYKTVKIGNQLWMAENLAFKTDSGCWAYESSPENIEKNGYLYDWKTANTVCPIGWHLPSKEEFETLLNQVGGVGSAAYNSLISIGSSGFSAPFSGFRVNTSVFYGIGEDAYFWSSSPSGENGAWHLYIYSGYSEASIVEYGRSYGFSVRCLQDN